MEVPPPTELLHRVRALPAAQPLLERLGERPDVYLVGGAVRDLLLGGAPFDLDLVVEGEASRLAAALGGAVRAHDRFGTSTVVLNGHSYDIARARTEIYLYPGALPQIRPAPLSEDLLRRDFTVNAAAIALAGEKEGELIAVPSMLEDLDARLLRVLHDRSFLDDPTRLLRLARYAARLGFAVEPHSEALARAAVDRGAVATVSGPRVGTELKLLAGEEDPMAAMGALRQLGLDRAIDSRFGIDDQQLASRALALLPAEARRDRLVLALASRRIPPEELVDLLDKLGVEATDRDAIAAAVLRSRGLASVLAAAQRPSQIAQAAIGADPEVVALAGALGPADQAGEWLARLRHVRLAIDGRDLIAAGVQEGPAVGRGLRAALLAKLDGQADDRETELARALQAAGATG